MRRHGKRTQLLLMMGLVSVISGCAQFGSMAARDVRGGFRPPAALSSMDASFDARGGQRS